MSLLICRGEDIFISIWNLHRSPRLWDGADKFEPERWPLDGPNPNETNQNFKYITAHVKEDVAIHKAKSLYML